MSKAKAINGSTEVALLEDKAVYLAPSGELQLDVQIDSETVWLSQAQIANCSR